MTEYTYFADMSGADIAGVVSAIIAVLGVFAFVATRIYKFGQNSQIIKNIEIDIKENIKPEIKNLRDTMTSHSNEIRDKLDDILKTMTLKQVSQSNSPRALNDFGKQVLRDSGIAQIVETKLDEIVEAVKSNNPENAYQVQELLLDITQDLKNDAGLKNDIEKAAFKSGVTVETVLLVGGINIRDNVLRLLNMNPEEIEQHEPPKQ